jgi:hypothetical protein
MNPATSYLYFFPTTQELQITKISENDVDSEDSVQDCQIKSSSPRRHMELGHVSFDPDVLSFLGFFRNDTPGIGRRVSHYYTVCYLAVFSFTLPIYGPRCT